MKSWKHCLMIFAVIVFTVIGTQAVMAEDNKETLENGTLTSGFPLGVSNHFTGTAARITVAKGSLLVIWDRKNGLPNRK